MSMGMEPGTRTGRVSAADWESLGVDARTSPSPAVRGRAPGSVAWTGSEEGKGLATFLGWFSVGLGTAQLLAPRALARLVGARGSGTSSAIMRAAGLRELGTGLGILANPTSKEWVGTRVAGDMLDLALLGATLATARRKDRTLLATAAVLGVTALDVMATEALAESRKAPSPEVGSEPGTHVHRSVTVEAPLEEVYRFWRDFANLPRFMPHLESVRDLGGGRARWTARGPGGSPVEWAAELTGARAGRRAARAGRRWSGRRS
jgi:hypothetical protein